MRSRRKPAKVSALSEMFKKSSSITKEFSDTDETDEEEESVTRHPNIGAVTVQEGIISQPTEATALLLKKVAHGSDPQTYGSVPDIESQRGRRKSPQTRIRHFSADLKDQGISVARRFLRPSSWDRHKAWDQVVSKPASYIPPVILGLLLNILDALSYGQPIFAELGPDGISMYYVSCIVSQLVYSLGGSIFKGGVGSEMIEVVPFFHKMAFTILNNVGEENRNSVLATTVLSYALSSVMTGLVFFIMGNCKLGTLIGFFPRHILIGCIGGVGWFLVATGVEVSARLDGNLNFSLTTLRKLVQLDTAMLWLIPLVLAVILILVKHWVKHAFVDATYFLSIIAIFYFLVATIPDLQLSELRTKGWLFAIPDARAPFYHFYELYDFHAVDWKALASTVPAMLALTFFGILHVPINVPALGVTIGEDNVDVDRELRAHGLSNTLSGFFGSVQNYLVYTNTVLFVRSGGNSRVAGIMLAFATFGILVTGPVIVGYVPIMVVGALIFFLGIDLMREALIETWGKVHHIEYIIIIIIVATMGIWDFVIGILVGIVLACVSFVLQTSRVSAIRNSLSGGVATSTVRRHPIQHRFLQDAGKQIYVMKLAGYLFFGTIVGVEKQIRALLGGFEEHPIRFLVLDLHNVYGVDFSAAEAFTRVKRILNAKGVRLIVCGISIHSEIGTALCNVGLFDAEDGIQYLETLNSALEHCENELLISLYQQRGPLAEPEQSPTFLNIPKPDRPTISGEVMFSSPRRKLLHEVARTTFDEQDPVPLTQWQDYKQPLQLILQTFSTVSDKPEDFWYRAVPFFERKDFPVGSVLYSREEAADGFYLLESGMLKAEYILPQLGKFSELIVEGTTCGELPFFSKTCRTSTTTAERDCVTWVLSLGKWEEVQKDEAGIAQELLKISLKLTSERMDAITKYMLLMSG
ncbi:MAG: hypothetical protein Q9167_000674 [Letrouitia subvulpina]